MLNNKMFTKIWFLLSITSFIMFFFIYYFNKGSFFIEWELFIFFSFSIQITFILDYISLLMISTVCFIASNIYLFAKDYMNNELHNLRFNLILSLFIMSMIILSIVPNLIILLVGWDGLGITSFLLVIYYSSPKSLSSGMITALTNRFGDALLMICIVLLISESNLNISNLLDSKYLNLISLLLILAAFTKSAQIPFSSWLPAAMAAPTPVSALVHSSTLVTAGVYILIRLYPFISNWYYFSKLILILSCLTMIMAGMNAMLEVDLKKIVALSTLSQLSVMMFCIGINMNELAFFHLLTHALFKSLMFVSVGYMMLINFHSQDIRMFGNMNMNIFTSSGFLISNLALMAWPFLAAFYSKDVMLELTWYSNFNSILFLILIMATCFTTVYSIRSLIMTLWSPNSFFCVSNFHDQNITYFKSILYLALGGIMSGSFFNWMIFQPMNHVNLSFFWMFFPIFLIFIGIFLYYLLFSINNSKMNLLNYFNKFILWFNFSMWTLSKTSCQPWLLNAGYSSIITTKIIDQGWMVGILGKSFINFNMKFLNILLKFNNKMYMFQLFILIMFFFMLIY